MFWISYESLGKVWTSSQENVRTSSTVLERGQESQMAHSAQEVTKQKRGTLINEISNSGCFNMSSRFPNQLT